MLIISNKKNSNKKNNMLIISNKKNSNKKNSNKKYSNKDFVFPYLFYQL